MAAKHAATAAAPAAEPPAAPGIDPALMAKYHIRDDVPLPASHVGTKTGTMYPFGLIGVGQSFFVGVSDTLKEPHRTITSLASHLGRTMHPKSFATRKDTEDGVTGVRVWRVADKVGELPPPKKIGKRRTKEEMEADKAGGSAETPPAPPVE